MKQLGFAAVATAVLAAVLASPAVGQSDDDAAAFRAAGFARQAGEWRKCEDPGTASYTSGSLERMGDLNGDGQPEAVVSESSTFCYGFEGTGFALVSRQADGNWKLLLEGSGIPVFLDSKGPGGWPDVEIGGPGFCFPRVHWTGSEYREVGFSYEGKACER